MDKNYLLIKKLFAELFLSRQLALKSEAPDGKVFPHLVKFYGSSYHEKDEVMELQLIMELCHTDLGKRIKEEHLLVFSDPEQPNIAFPGRTVKDHQPPCKKSVFHAIDAARQAASGLEFIHQNGIVHRDVKANNFLMNQIEDDIVIKISDFGVSRDIDMITTIGKSVGTKPYHAPEFYTHRCTTHTFSTDVYSFGLLIGEIWYGEEVFNNVSSDHLIEHIVFQGPEWKGDNPPPRALTILMKKCGHKKSEKRPEMKDVLDELKRLAEESKKDL